MENVHEFEATESLSMENSFMVLKEEEDIKLHVTVGLRDTELGWFEIYDLKTEGNEWHAAGGLWFDGKKVTGYDGVFALPLCVIDKLKELGYNTSEVE